MSYAILSLSAGQFTLVDACDIEWLRQQGSWHYSHGYAKCCLAGGKGKRAYLHRLLAQPPAGFEVDHRNGDKLDNRRSNLRVVTQSQNGRNIGRKDYGTGVPYKGIYRKGNRWVARVWFQGRAVRIGSFLHAEDAARAYDNRARSLFGDDFRPNFP